MSTGTKASSRAWLTLIALALVWGSSYLLIKKSLADFAPQQVGYLRLTVAGLSFLPVAIQRCRGFSWQDWAWLLVVGLTGTGLPSFLFPYAQTELSSSMTAALSSLNPLMTLVVAVIVFGSRLQRRQLFGILVGLIGAFLLVLARYGWTSLTAGAIPFLNLSAAVLALICYAISSNVVSARFSKTDSLTVSAGAFVPIGLAAGVMLLVVGDMPTGFSESSTLWTSYLAVAFLGLVGTALASWLFFRLIQLTEPVFASTVSYLVPIVATGWGLVDGEQVTLLMVATLGLILFGVFLSRKRQA